MAPSAVQMVRGPATVQVIGRCHVLGMDVSLRTIEVRAGKALPFELDADCKLDVQGGESWIAGADNAGTCMWQEIAENILALGSAAATTVVVMVVGATDTGKSTFSTYLANLALGRGIVPCIVDGDIGQGDLAPPTALGAAVIKEQVVDLRDAQAGLFEFVGAITPAGAEKLVAQKLKSLVGRMKKTMMMTTTATPAAASLKIVNTDGYSDPLYKWMLASVVSPDVVICMGQDSSNNNNDLARALLGRWELFVAPSSSAQVLKTHSERVGRRMEQYIRHVGDGLVSKSTDAARFFYRNRPIPRNAVLALGPEGMFVALGSRRRIAGFGVIESMDAHQVSIRTGVQDFSTIHASEIRLRKNHEERITFFSSQARGP
jgi:polynucleotide 5'-hydroxyl-kinase GRC3/NOL9